MARRWNGWGDAAVSVEPSAAALAFLTERTGAPTPPRSASRDEALRALSPSRLPPGAPFDTGADTRLDHAFGQAMPDWIAVRSGRTADCADGVACPGDGAGVAAVLAAARASGAAVIPYGGGTSVAGHLRVRRGADTDRPVVDLSLERLQGLVRLDPDNRIATFGAGTPGPEVECALAAHGLTLGHYPQSFELSTVGGWVATRSSGQQSLRYGRIEQLFHGARLATPKGPLAVGGFPASSAGPDLREAVLGSEGRLGVLTEVDLRVRRRPEVERFDAIFFPDWEAGVAALRELAQQGAPLSMLRLADPVETRTQLALAQGHGSALAWLERYLRWRGVSVGDDRGRGCLLIAGATGNAAEVRHGVAMLRAAARRRRGVAAGGAIGAAWARNRFRSPYLRNGLWDAGFAVDTVETCVAWTRATAAAQAIHDAARAALATEGERVHAFSHLSHVYAQGCSVYSTFVYRLAGDADTDLERWRRLKNSTSAAIVASGGTISHQHGVGVDHAPWLEREKGVVGTSWLRALLADADPDGMMNPGKLLA